MAGFGRMTEIVAVDRETTLPDSEDVPTWEEVGRFRAEVKPLRASESEREGAVRTLSVYQFTAHARAAKAIGLNTTHKLRWEGMSFNVREVRTPPDRVLFVDIIAETGVTL